MASILQTDGLFQEYQEKGRRKVQSSFLLPDLYTGYTTDFNRSTAQMAMEITEKQVFQPERRSIAWVINNKLLNGYGFKYVEVGFSAPDMTNPDDISKMLTIAEKAGGVTLNDAREIARETLGKTAEEYPQQFDMNDIGNVPLVVLNTMTGRSGDSSNISGQLQKQITKAENNQDNDVVAVLKEVRSTLIRMGGEDNE
jgi:capsid portal protein